MISRVPEKLAFNDSFANFKDSIVPQGGPARFAMLFRKYEKKRKRPVVGILFSQDNSVRKVSHRAVKKGGKSFHEILLPYRYFPKIYKKNLSRAEFLKYTESVLAALQEALREEKPKAVFLNGFSLTNWILLEAASRELIPVVILHAGIWKEEVRSSQGSAFSPAVRKLWYRCEKDIIQKARHQIFLNEFSKKKFEKLHSVTLKQASIIPLPFELPTKIKTFDASFTKKNNLHIGAVGRWDKIKNHSALDRLGSAIQKARLPWELSVVTNPSSSASGEFLHRYRSHVHLVKPMHPRDLREWYRTIDLLVVPSRFDVSPTVVLEALAAGKPVIISDQVGWVDSFRKHGLHRCIIKTTASGETQRKAIKHVQQNWGTYVQKFQKLQRELLRAHDPDTVFPRYNRIINSL